MDSCSFRPPVSLTMALSPARYSHSLLPPVPPPPMVNREPTPKQDTSDNDGILPFYYIFIHIKHIKHLSVACGTAHDKPPKRNEM